MAVVAVATILGDPKELLAKYDKVSAKLGSVPPAGSITHTCVVLDNGIRVVNMYETEDQARAGNERPEFVQALRDAGMPQAERQTLQVHHYVISGS